MGDVPGYFSQDVECHVKLSCGQTWCNFLASIESRQISDSTQTFCYSADLCFTWTCFLLCCPHVRPPIILSLTHSHHGAGSSQKLTFSELVKKHHVCCEIVFTKSAIGPCLEADESSSLLPILLLWIYFSIFRISIVTSYKFCVSFRVSHRIEACVPHSPPVLAYHLIVLIIILQIMTLLITHFCLPRHP